MKKYFCIAAACLMALPAFAQKGNIGFVYPTGARQGTTVEITVGGQNLSKATGVLVSGSGVTGELIALPQKGKKKGKKNIGEEDNLQLADKVKFRLTIAPDAAPGIRDLQLTLPGGITNRLYFEIGCLPDVNENPKAELSASSASLPVTFNGQITRSDIDRFRFPAKKGQQLVICVKARVFVPYMADAVPGWFQPIARLYGPDGKEVAFNDDYSFHIDPVIFYKVPVTGDYEVEINDALFRGREDFVYRIDVGELPFITSISPIGGRSGKKTAVKLSGYNLAVSSVEVNPRKEGIVEVKAKSPAGLLSNAALFDATSRNPLDTRKLPPNLSATAAWGLTTGDCVENVFAKPMQQHWYKFAVEAKQAIHINVVARHLGAPTDVRMTLYDAAGKIVADVDDFEDEDDCMTTHFADPQYTKQLPAGEYFIRIVESQGNAGAAYSYRLYLSKASPDFSLHMEPAIFTVPAGGTGLFNVLITRKQNFNGQVDIKMSGLPKTFKVSGNVIHPKQNKTLISVSAPESAEKGIFNPSVKGTASNNDLSITRDGIPVESMMQAFYYTHLMPIDDFRMEVTGPHPFKLSIVRDWTGELILGGGAEVPLKVRVERSPGFTSPVTLMLKSSLGGVKADAVIVGENQSEGTLMLRSKATNKGKRPKYAAIAVSGIVKGSSKKIAGKSRDAFVAAITAYTPVVEVIAAQ